MAAGCRYLYFYDDEKTGSRFMGCLNKVFGVEIDVEVFGEAERTRHGFGGVKLTGRRCRSAARASSAPTTATATPSSASTAASSAAAARRRRRGGVRPARLALALARARRSRFVPPRAFSPLAQLPRERDLLRVGALPLAALEQRGQPLEARLAQERREALAAELAVGSSAWRSRFDPSGVCESFTCTQARRSTPTTESNSSMTAASLSIVRMS